MERQASGVAGYPAHRGLRRVTHSGLEFGLAEVVIDGSVQVDQAPLYQDHQACGCERLGDRGQGIRGVFGSRDVSLTIGQAEPFLPHDRAITSDGHGH